MLFILQKRNSKTITCPVFSVSETKITQLKNLWWPLDSFQAKINMLKFFANNPNLYFINSSIDAKNEMRSIFFLPKVP